jgi:hypothetical protein
MYPGFATEPIQNHLLLNTSVCLTKLRELLGYNIMVSEQIYQVVKQQNAYTVADSSNRTVVTCHNELNAQHYAELLNKAYERGYKAGYKAGKLSVD